MWFKWWCFDMTSIRIRHHHHHHHHHRQQQQQQLRSLACSSGGVVVDWPAQRLTGLLDRRHHDVLPLTDAVSDDVRWTLPYVTTSTTPQTQPVISASLAVYSNHSQRSLAVRGVCPPRAFAANFFISSRLPCFFLFPSPCHVPQALP